MLKKTASVVVALAALASAQNVMAKDVRPAAVSLKPAVAAPVDAPAPARARVGKRNDIFGLPALSGLGLVAVGGIALTAAVVAATSSGGSPG